MGKLQQTNGSTAERARSESSQEGGGGAQVVVMSYECSGAASTRAAAVVAVGVAARQVRRGHEWVALVGAAVLCQRIHALLAGGLPGVCQGAVAVGVPRHQIHAVLQQPDEEKYQEDISE